MKTYFLKKYVPIIVCFIQNPKIKQALYKIMFIVSVISYFIHYYNTVWLFWQFWDIRLPWKLPFFKKSNTPTYIFLFLFEFVIKFYTTYKKIRKSYETLFSISLIILRIHVYFSHFLFGWGTWKTHFLKKYVQIIICFIQNH